MARILVCEVDKCGLDHILFNASMLETVLLAFPEDDIEFLAEETHWREVDKVLGRHGQADRSRLHWKGIEFDSPRTGFREVLLHETWWTQRIADELATTPCRFVLVCSITDSGLMALKLRMLRGSIDAPVLAVPHSILSSLAHFQSPRPWRRVVNLRNVMRSPQPSGLRLIALGESIYKHVEQYAPALASQFSVLDHPYFWDAEEPADAPKPLRFGYLGVTGKNKGFSDFYRLAESIRPDFPEVEFQLVGFVNEAVETATYGDAVQGIDTKPLDRAAFRALAQALTYVVWTANPKHYELTASATFLDTLSYLKPGIYYRNPFVESYFDRMGDIGYLCNSFEETRDTIRSICEDFPAERYRMQCENMLRGRGLLDPSTLAATLRSIVDDAARSRSR